MSLPAKILVQFLLNTILVLILASYMPQYLFMTGGLTGAMVVGILLTMLNAVVRPALALVTFPLELLTHAVAFIVANTLFLWFVDEVIIRIDPNIVTMQITGGITGWLAVGIALGIGNWVLKHVVK